ncbi:hypothetical protein F4801DRAFT_27576 [Xylaria longipes]|nr:hypothetical protein F4801DRAFT_27576 [Xylaria longipes]
MSSHIGRQVHTLNYLAYTEGLGPSWCCWRKAVGPRKDGGTSTTTLTKQEARVSILCSVSELRLEPSHLFLASSVQCDATINWGCQAMGCVWSSARMHRNAQWRSAGLSGEGVGDILGLLLLLPLGQKGFVHLSVNQPTPSQFCPSASPGCHATLSRVRVNFITVALKYTFLLRSAYLSGYGDTVASDHYISWVWLHWAGDIETAQLPSDMSAGQSRVSWHEPSVWFLLEGGKVALVL